MQNQDQVPWGRKFKCGDNLDRSDTSEPASILQMSSTTRTTREAIKAGVGAGAGAIRIKAGAGALLFLSNYARRFAHMT